MVSVEKKTLEVLFLLIMAIICIGLEYFAKSATVFFSRGHFGGVFFADTLYFCIQVYRLIAYHTRCDKGDK